MKTWISAVVLLLGWCMAQSQTPAPAQLTLSERDFLDDMPVVLSVSRLPQRLDETPGAVTVLDRRMIRQSGARDVADLLRLVPGFQISNSFETGAPLISYHGAFDGYSARIQVLVDGRSVYSPYLFGGVGPGLQIVPLDDIERIEILRGSNSATYGARAMLGVVNIVTRTASDSLGWQAQVGAGGAGILDNAARGAWGSPQASFRMSADSRSDVGLNGSNGHNQVNRVNLRADLRPSPRDEVQLRAGVMSIRHGAGFANRVDDALRERQFDARYAQIDWRLVLDDDQDMGFGFSHTEESLQDAFAFSLAPLGINDYVNIDSSGRASNDQLSLQHTFRQGADLRVVWGGELRREQASSRPLYNTDAAFVTDFNRLFGSVEWRATQQLVLNAGAMAEHSSAKGSSFSPRAMLNWHPARGHTLRAGYSRASRPPSTFENSSDVRFIYQGLLLQTITLSTGKVQPEVVSAREIGYLGEFPAWRANLDVRLFHEQISGFVRSERYLLTGSTSVLPSAPRDYVNSESFAISGVEYQFKWRPWRDTQVLLNQTWTNIRSFDPGTALAAPKLASTLTVFQRLPAGLDLSLIFQDSGSMSLQGTGTGDQAPIRRTDVRLAAPLRLGTHQAEIALVVQNLGAPYQDYLKEFQFQRRAFVTLSLQN